MKILFDVMFNNKLKEPLKQKGFYVETAIEKGWSNLTNGELLAQCSKEGFDVLLTLDKDFQFNQNIRKFSVAVFLVRAVSDQIQDLQLFFNKIVDLLSEVSERKLYLLIQDKSDKSHISVEIY